MDPGENPERVEKDGKAQLFEKKEAQVKRNNAVAS